MGQELERLELRLPEVRIEGVLYRRVVSGYGEYMTVAGPVKVRPRTAGGLRGMVLGATSSGQPRPVHRLGAAGAAAEHPAATRFLILPWVRVPHLASHILGRMARMLSADWQRLYGHPIYFVETFIDPQRFRGTCYRAANWTVRGSTTGRGKDAPTRQANRSKRGPCG